MSDKIIEIHNKWQGQKVMVDFYDPHDPSRTVLGQVEIRIPSGDDTPYIASEDNLGRDLLPRGFCDNAWRDSALGALPDEVWDRLSDDSGYIPVRNRFGVRCSEYTVYTPYAAGSAK